MQELSRYLFLAGGLLCLLLGTAHVVHTPQQPSERKGMSPADPSLAESMARSRVLLTGRTDIWRVWVGINLSHSLGVILLGLTVLLVGRTPASFAYNAVVFIPLAVVVSLAYLGLGLVYWFRTPIIAVGLSVLLFSSAWVLSLVARQ